MVAPNEVLMLLFASGVTVFLIVGRRKIAALPHGMLLAAAFYAGMTGWIMTVAEGFVWPKALNLAEHLSYAVSSALLAAWCWVVLGRRERK